jgi:hypothetical protein
MYSIYTSDPRIKFEKFIIKRHKLNFDKLLPKLSKLEFVFFDMGFNNYTLVFNDSNIKDKKYIVNFERNLTENELVRIKVFMEEMVLKYAI